MKKGWGCLFGGLIFLAVFAWMVVWSNGTRHVLLVIFPCSSRSNFPVRLFQFPCSVIFNSLLFRNRELPSNHLKYRWLPREKMARSASKWPKFPVNSLLLMAASRDRIAPNCTIRHPVWPIVALQRRVRFSAQLAGFCRIRWHQRRARRAEKTSFSDFVSNLDFRVPSLRQRRKGAADRALRQQKRGHPRGPESRPVLPRRSWPMHVLVQVRGVVAAVVHVSSIRVPDESKIPRNTGSRREPLPVSLPSRSNR